MVSTSQHHSSRPCCLSTMISGSKIPVWIPFCFPSSWPTLFLPEPSPHTYHELYLWLHIPLVPWILVSLPSAWTSWKLVLSMFLPTLRRHVPLACCWPCLTHPQLDKSSFRSPGAQHCYVSEPTGLPVHKGALISARSNAFFSNLCPSTVPIIPAPNLVTFLSVFSSFHSQHLVVLPASLRWLGCPPGAFKLLFVHLTFSWHLLHLLVLPSCFKGKQLSCPTHLF